MEEMIVRKSREKLHGQYTPKLEEQGGHTKRNHPPSRHLWVGNLSPRMNKTAIVEQFLRYGELDSVAYTPGRSYAFVNFKKDDDAIVAMGALQGSVFAGMPIKIEFTKGERSCPSSSGDQHVEHKNGLQDSVNCVEQFSQKDLYARQVNVEKHSDRVKGGSGLEPSEVLWIGFPLYLNVDETILRKAFAPYGEIDRITTFPGRSYAFVKFISVVSACRAKDALQGKLFNNPRVNITFAKSEVGPAEHAKISNSLISSKPISSSALESSPRFFSSFTNLRDPAPTGIGRMDPCGGYDPISGSLDQIRPHGGSLEQRIADELYEHRLGAAATEKCGQKLDFLLDRAQRPGIFDGTWATSDDLLPFHQAKKMKMGSFSDNELPEYPFADTSQRKLHAEFPGLFPQRNLGPLDYNKFMDHPKNLHPHYANKDELWKARGSYETGPSPSHMASSVGQRLTPDIHTSPPADVWKWEGTIAKGGTPVCRARCLPVGRVLDFMLPEFLNCTARTSLDMLAKHYYQAASSWVVFFVAETDSDIMYYNEFMHYLEEKQRVAVAKLSEKTTLFLVPPSDFSEKVLKVPGKMSISGVILKFHHFSSDQGSTHVIEATKPKPLLPGSLCRPSFSSSSLGTWGSEYGSLQLGRRLQSSSSVPHGIESPDQEGNLDSPYENRQHKFHSSQMPNWMPEIEKSSPPNQNDTTGVSVPSFQPEQLAQLASLLGQRQQQQEHRKTSIPSDHGAYLHTLPSPSESALAARRPPEDPDRASGSSNFMAPHIGPIQQSGLAEAQGGSLDPQESPQVQEEGESDPQKRLQATLQLAAALLQQLQQQTRTVD